MIIYLDEPFMIDQKLEMSLKEYENNNNRMDDPLGAELMVDLGKGSLMHKHEN
jgi:hypothetical protein